QVGSHCQDCPGRRGCPTLRKNAGAVCDWTSRAWPVELPPEAAGLELQMAETMLAQLEAHVTGLREQVEYQIRDGQPNPFWQLEAGKSSEKWNAPHDEIIALGDMLEVDLRKAQQLVTPIQAKEILHKAKLDKSVIAEYSQRVPGSMKLVPAETTLASRVFGA